MMRLRSTNPSQMLSLCSRISFICTLCGVPPLQWHDPAQPPSVRGHVRAVYLHGQGCFPPGGIPMWD
eukprot:2463248-Karenia_brevis.AAC.1